MADRQTKIPTKHLECPVCMDTYNDPRMLPCGHSVCKLCIDGLVSGQYVICAVCRAKHDKAQIGTGGFPSNFVVVGIINSLKEVDEPVALVAVSCFLSTYGSRPSVVGEKGSGPGQFLYPRDVAVCPVTGRVMVADYGNRRVQVLDDDFTHIMNIPAAGQGEDLRAPCGVAVNSTGEVIVLDYAAGRVSVYSGTGTYLRDLPGPWCNPAGITVDGDDNVYVSDADTHTVTVMKKTGQAIRSIGGEGSRRGKFQDKPWCIVVRRDDAIVSDTAGRLHRFNKSGDFKEHLKTGKVQHATGLDVDPFGNLVIADTEGPVKVLNDKRAVRCIGESGDEAWHLCTPQGVTVTKMGQIVVANWGHHNLLVYEVTT